MGVSALTSVGMIHTSAAAPTMMVMNQMIMVMIIDYLRVRACVCALMRIYVLICTYALCHVRV